MSGGKDIHKKIAPDGEFDSVEARREGDLVFAGNQQTGEVATRESGWVDFCRLKKSTARKLAEAYVEAAVEQWVEAAGIAEHVDTIVGERLPAIVDKLIAGKVERIADEILESMLREKLGEHLRGELGFEFEVRVVRSDGAS